MCLSKVYEVRDGAETLLSEYVSGVDVSGDIIVFKDIMGAETSIRGSIKSIDLVKNVIIVGAAS